jgi:hypothetical protein
MDETPEELEQIRREAANIDVHQYRRRVRFLAAIGLGALGAGVVALVLRMTDDRRNPCERVREYLCQKGTPIQCETYRGIAKESVDEGSAEMRRNIRAQCAAKIERLKAEDGVDVP